MFRHVGIVVKDIDKQLFFYRDLLGMRVLYNEVECGDFLDKIISIKDSKINIYKLGFDNIIVELLHYFKNNESDISIKNINDFGITHFAITVINIDKIYDKLLQNSITFLSNPEINHQKTHKVCFCRDYENNLIELVQEL
jgi:catechol 2,3-dioxygenase-like lactoylglutathione lyase family enzyme